MSPENFDEIGVVVDCPGIQAIIWNTSPGILKIALSRNRKPWRIKGQDQELGTEQQKILDLTMQKWHEAQLKNDQR
jgi:hypothetical protein